MSAVHVTYTKASLSRVLCKKSTSMATKLTATAGENPSFAKFVLGFYCLTSIASSLWRPKKYRLHSLVLLDLQSI